MAHGGNLPIRPWLAGSPGTAVPHRSFQSDSARSKLVIRLVLSPALPVPRSSPQYEQYKLKEIKNGRLAMLAFLGFAAQYGATGKVCKGFRVSYE